MKPIHPVDWALPLAFATGGGIAAWSGFNHWAGVWWWFLTLLSGIVLGGQFRRWRIGR